jgi:pimeloyl-ACP methyl ester carboxylesterase
VIVNPEARAEGTVTRDDFSVHYQLFGDHQRAILLLPTWSIVHSDFWCHQVPHLSARYTVVTFDGRGNGASDRPLDAAAYAEQSFVDDALAVLDVAEIEQAAIVSLSGGAAAGLIIASKNPKRVPAAVFIAPSLPLAPPGPERATAMAAFNEPQEVYEGWFKFNRHYWQQDWPDFLEFFFGQCFTESNSTEQIHHFVQMGLETSADVITATAEAPGPDDEEIVELATSIRCPTLVIHGDADVVSPLKRGQELARLSGAELAVLPGSGHQPQYRSPDVVNDLLDEFLDRHYPAAPT